MSNEKFTQGDWKVDKKGDIKASDGFLIAETWTGDAVGDEDLANNNLIAAAPEMYLLLADIAKSIDHCGGEIDVDFMKVSIDKILAKARGEDV